LQKTRLDQFLVLRHPYYSRTQIKRLIEQGFVLINDEKILKPSFLLHGGEKIEMVRRMPEIPEAQPEELPLTILYEDADLIVINKAAGMVVHPAPGNITGTLVNAILHHSKDLQGIGDVKRPGIVHRLDKGTSGVMVIAKNDAAHRDLSKQFKDRKVDKTYQALVFGKLLRKEGTIAFAIGRDKAHRRKFSSRTQRGRDAVTHYKLTKQYEGLAHLTIKLETGRTHQIRVHLSESHHPIVGDTLYGAKSYLSSIRDNELRLRLEEVSRPLLHAAELKFTHPRSKEWLEFAAPLPKDFKEVISSL
jgi:23S rRNA pseudouridine1911/1915/1917 synthase